MTNGAATIEPTPNRPSIIPKSISLAAKLFADHRRQQRLVAGDAETEKAAADQQRGGSGEDESAEAQADTDGRQHRRLEIDGAASAASAAARRSARCSLRR
jgi:hypothetical protein